MIYVMEPGMGRHRPFKVGYAGDVPKRMRRHQTSNHRKLYVVAEFPGGLALEHTILKALEPLRTHGEWFRGDLPASAEFVSWAIHQEFLWSSREAALAGVTDGLTTEEIDAEIRSAAFAVSRDGQHFHTMEAAA